MLLKCYDHTCINTFAGVRNVIDDVRNNNVNFHLKYVNFEGDTQGAHDVIMTSYQRRCDVMTSI